MEDNTPSPEGQQPGKKSAAVRPSPLSSMLSIAGGVVGIIFGIFFISSASGDPETGGLNSSVIANDGALVVCGKRMNLPYMYRATMARTSSWGSTWEKDRFDDAYGACHSVTSDASKRMNAVMGLEPNYAVVRSLDNGVTWGSESIITDSRRGDIPPLSTVTSDGRILVIWFSGREIHSVRGE